MMRAMLSGVSGLKTHQQKMDVIGNNIANINTTAFKASRVTFSDIFSQTLSSATGSDSTTGRAGSNAKQIGLGTQVAAIDTLMTRGSTETTGSSTDLAINGNGFFIVRSGTTGSYMFTRAGDFKVDENGNLTTSSGMNVYGWLDNTSGDYDTDKTVEALNLYSDSYSNNKQILAGSATEKASLTGSLNSSDTTSSDAYTTTMTTYDSLGNKHELTVSFQKKEAGTAHNDADGNSDPITTWSYTISGDSGATVTAGTSGTIQFHSDGTLATSDQLSTTTTTYDITPSITITPASSTGAAAYTFDLDLSDITTTAGDSTVEVSDVDGYAAGTLEDIAIDSNGLITGTYSNGKTQSLGLIALAQFDNAAGLESVGGSYYQTTANSGDFVNGVKASGTLASGSLEMSNVDLSTEFASMIVTQRGYQANSKIITVSDEMLETVVNMKR